MNYKLNNGKSLLIAPAEPEDAADFLMAVAKMGGETPYLTFGAEGVGLSVEQERDFLAGARRPGGGLMLKAVVDGTIVGSLGVTRVPRERVRHAVEFGVSVLKSHWGLGIGRHLMEEMIAWAKGADIRKINLRVHESNLRAKTLYEKMGFKEEGFRTRAFRDETGAFFGEWMMGMELDP